MGLLKEKNVSVSGLLKAVYWTLAPVTYDVLTGTVTTIMCGFINKFSRDMGDPPVSEQVVKNWIITDLLIPESVKIELNTELDNLTYELFGRLTTNQQRVILYHNWTLSKLDDQGNETNWFADAENDL